MSKALYRQYRPQTFDQLLGQGKVVRVLKNQIASQSFSHAYIFAGERGCGKTSAAKIFAKAINCLNPTDGSPCLKCKNCLDIDDGSSIDIIEMDAASNRRIDDIRNLKDNVIYPPSKLKYKVYIIDEAHMITKEAFNALLKIMEEPPSHVVFILATTEIEKIPTTILSRVQKFEFNKIDPIYIKKQIKIILDDKSIIMDDSAIDLIINKANGAMRDALSILDTIISSSDNNISLEEVESLLGAIEYIKIDKLTRAILSNDETNSLMQIKNLRQAHKSDKDILESLTGYIHDLMIYKINESLLNIDNQDRLVKIKDSSTLVETDRLVDMLEILDSYRNKFKQSENTNILCEIMILRLIHTKTIDNIDSRLRQLENMDNTNIIGIVNKLVDEKLSKININQIKPLDNEKSTFPTDNNLENKNVKDLSSKKVEDVNDNEIIDNKESINNEQNPLTNSEKSLIKEKIISIAGNILSTLFDKEGFNYHYKDNNFILYLKDDFYKIFIDTKVEEISQALSDILDNEVNFYSKKFEENIDTSDKIENINNKLKTNNNNIENLKEIFGDELEIK